VALITAPRRLGAPARPASDFLFHIGFRQFHRDRTNESSGSSTPPAAQSQSDQNAATNRPDDWDSNCADHPYTPGPARACK
jgi:hypothetical protein